MGDEPKRRSRSWAVAVLIAVIVLLLLYVASFPLVMKLSLFHDVLDVDTAVYFYSPLLWSMHRSETLHDAIDWYTAHVAGGFTFDDERFFD